MLTEIEPGELRRQLEMKSKEEKAAGLFILLAIVLCGVIMVVGNEPLAIDCG